MLKLYFNLRGFPRTVNREQWRRIWRWKRETEKKLDEEAQRQMNNFVVYGATWPEHIRADFLEKSINPPLVMHELQR